MSDEDIDIFHAALEKSLQKLNKGDLVIKEHQYEALKSIVVQGKDTVCIMPTGYGKSLIYQLLPFMFDSCLSSGNESLSSSSVIVISPLNALMIDQISKLKEYVDVSVLRASREPASKQLTTKGGVSLYQQIVQPSQIIFAHPEALIEDRKVFQNILKSKGYQDRVKAIVVDEAHLVEEWKNFRPCYGKLGMLASVFPKVPFLALTATATSQTKKDITASLGLLDPIFVEVNPDRPNIFFSSCRRQDRGEDKLHPILTPLVEELQEKRLEFPLTLVYGNLETIGECFMFTTKKMGFLQYEPVGSSPVALNRMFTQFHAQYPEHERERIVKDLVSGISKLRLLFVTIAFGIGVDVANIRRVIHIGVPHTIEEYYQEAGRCGRDRMPASSMIYFNSYDISASRNISHHMKELVMSDRCKREIILSYLGHKVPKRNLPDHSCCDFHQHRCCCEDCLLVSAVETMEINDGNNSPDYLACSSEGICDNKTVAMSLEQKVKLREHLLKYRQLLHGSGRTCVGSIGLCTGFGMELVNVIVEQAGELTSFEQVKAKLPLFDDNHAVVIFEILRSIKEGLS